MCYRKTNTKTKIEMEQRYKAEFLEFDFTPTFHENGFDHALSPVITMQDQRHFTPMYWGLIPFWTKSAEEAKVMKARTLNAKCETVSELPSFRAPIKSKRCLVPADGFFEWMDLNKKKYPHFISLKDNGLFSFGGIYDLWKDPSTGKEIGTYSIITTEANPLMAKIHNLKKRMPFILSVEDEALWLDKDATPEELKQIMKPFPEERMKAHTISKLITDTTQPCNCPEVMDAFTYPELNQGLNPPLQLGLF